MTTNSQHLGERKLMFLCVEVLCDVGELFLGKAEPKSRRKSDITGKQEADVDD